MPGIINKCKELRIVDDFTPYEGKVKAPLSMTCPECGYHNSCLRCGDNQGFCEACGFDIYEYLANKEKQKP